MPDIVKLRDQILERQRRGEKINHVEKRLLEILTHPDFPRTKKTLLAVGRRP